MVAEAKIALPCPFRYTQHTRPMSTAWALALNNGGFSCFDSSKTRSGAMSRWCVVLTFKSCSTFLVFIYVFPSYRRSCSRNNAFSRTTFRIDVLSPPPKGNWKQKNSTTLSLLSHWKIFNIFGH